VEEERRVLYVALTRAMDNLLVTRQSLATWAYADGQKSDTAIESYFFNDLPKGMFQEFMHNSAPNVRSPSNFRLESPMRMKGINLD
jgi:DNA helicase-2/ATP-dependent DNA helicase PcrA